jgi:PAS domain S-box-containing protein
MPRLHPLLVRQLARLGVDAHAAPSQAQWHGVLERVARAYQEAEQDRYLLERSQDLASAEMTELYRALEEDKAQLESRVEERTRRLRESETHLSEAQRIATLGSWSYVPQTNTQSWSEECYRLLGLDSADGPPPLHALIEHVHEEDRDRVRGLMGDAFDRGANGDIEFRVTHPGGNALWLHALLETFTGKEGEVVLLRGTLRDITREKRAEDERDFAIARLNTALNGSNLILVDVDPAGVVFLSEGWSELLGGDRRETYTTFDALIAMTHQDERERTLSEYVDVVTGRKSEYDFEHRVRAKDGSWKWIRNRGRVVERDAHGRARRLAGINEDVTARKEAEERVWQSDARFRSLLALSSDWYWEQDAQLKFTEVAGIDNARDRLDVAQLLSETSFDQGHGLERGRSRALQVAHRGAPAVQGHRADGARRRRRVALHQLLRRAGLRSRRRVRGIQGHCARRNADAPRRGAHPQARALRRAHGPAQPHDVHAHAAARVLARAAAQQAVRALLHRPRPLQEHQRQPRPRGRRSPAAGRRAPAAPSPARKRHGRAARRRRVRRAGRGLRRLPRAQRDRAEHPERGRQAVYAVRPRVPRDGQHRHLDLSRRRARPASLLKNADIAMYLAKDRGKNNFQFYSPQQNAHSFERLALESALRHALERREFVLHYQPKIDIRTNRIVGVEALLRWNHPDLGTVTPTSSSRSRKRPASSCRSGAGCCAPRARSRRVAQRWIARRAHRGESVGAPVLRRWLIGDIVDALAEAALPPEGLELEITESMVMQNPERAVSTLSRLRELGISVSIDDFGTATRRSAI